MTDAPDRLSTDDARILALESAAVAGHTLKLMILAPGRPLDLEALRASVLARLGSQPRALDRVELGGGAGSAAGAADPRSSAPHWVRAEHFDIAQHVRRRAGTECATRNDLRRTVSALMSEHLDRDRPLWTLDLIGPLADGTEAIAARMHHAMVDGIAGIRFLEGIVLDPHDAPVHTAGARRTELQPPKGEEWRRIPAAVVRELGHPGARSPFDRPITLARELAFTSTPLESLRSIGASRPNHATVNDVLLAIVAGGLHAWLHGREATRAVRAQVPVSLHHRDEDATTLGNRDSFINVDLPLGIDDPLRRLDHISAQTRTEKQLDDAALLYDLFHALGTRGPAAELAQRISGSPREFGVAISNVPGPRVPVSVAGRRVDQLFTSSEPAPHHALRISAISNATHIGIGFCTDPNALSGMGVLADAVSDSYERLRAAALPDPA